MITVIFRVPFCNDIRQTNNPFEKKSLFGHFVKFWEPAKRDKNRNFNEILYISLVWLKILSSYLPCLLFYKHILQVV